MKIRPYLTYRGNCDEAVALYKKAFRTDTLEVMRFSDIPSNPNFSIPAAYADKILQCTMKFGDDFIRLSDCGPDGVLNDPESERISIAVETNVADVQHAFTILAKEGRIGMPLAETFYSPCAGVVFDKFGVMWHFAGQA